MQIQPEPITQEYRDITEVALKNELKTAQVFMDPRILADLISEVLVDRDYLNILADRIIEKLHE